MFPLLIGDRARARNGTNNVPTTKDSAARNSTVCRQSRIFASHRCSACQQVQPVLAACPAGAGDARSDAAHSRSLLCSSTCSSSSAYATTQLLAPMGHTSAQPLALSMCSRVRHVLSVGMSISILLLLDTAGSKKTKKVWNAYRAREIFTC